MTIFLWIMASLFVYIFIGSAAAAKHHSISKKTCGFEDCFDRGWCGHACLSIWLIGPLWPFMIPALLGLKTGFSDKANRTEARRKRELEEAEHKRQLAEISAREHAALDSELARIKGLT